MRTSEYLVGGFSIAQRGGFEAGLFNSTVAVRHLKAVNGGSQSTDALRFHGCGCHRNLSIPKVLGPCGSEALGRPRGVSPISSVRPDALGFQDPDMMDMYGTESCAFALDIFRERRHLRG